MMKSDFEKLSKEETIKKLGTDLHKGLTSARCKQRLMTYGENILETKKKSIWFRLLSFFLGTHSLDDRNCRLTLRLSSALA